MVVGGGCRQWLVTIESEREGFCIPVSGRTIKSGRGAHAAQASETPKGSCSSATRTNHTNHVGITASSRGTQPVARTTGNSMLTVIQIYRKCNPTDTTPTRIWPSPDALRCNEKLARAEFQISRLAHSLPGFHILFSSFLLAPYETPPYSTRNIQDTTNFSTNWELWSNSACLCLLRSTIVLHSTISNDRMLLHG